MTSYWQCLTLVSEVENHPCNRPNLSKSQFLNYISCVGQKFCDACMFSSGPINGVTPRNPDKIIIN